MRVVGDDVESNEFDVGWEIARFTIARINKRKKIINLVKISV